MAYVHSARSNAAVALTPLASAVDSLEAPRVGARAPLFTLPDADMELFELRRTLQHSRVVLCFFSHSSHPSWRKQAIAYTDHEAVLKRLNAKVIGVGLDDCECQARFCDEHGIAVEMLSDPDGDVCERYAVLQWREMNGIVRPVVERKTFIIGRDNVIHHILDDTEPLTSVAQAIEFLKEF